MRKLAGASHAPGDALLFAFQMRWSSMGSAMYSRTPEQLKVMLKNWTVEDPDITCLNEWIETPNWYEGTGDNPDMYDGYGLIVSKS
jgi:hypothetical protein